MPWLAPLGTIILLSRLIAGIVLDASGLFFHYWFYISYVEQVGRLASGDSNKLLPESRIQLFAGSYYSPR